MADLFAGLHLVPSHMHDSIVLWIERGEPTPHLMGEFLKALLSNDLMGAFAHADDSNRIGMERWVRFLYNYAPSPCFGSPEKMQAWYDAHHPSPEATVASPAAPTAVAIKEDDIPW